MDNPNLKLNTEDKKQWTTLGRDLEDDFIRQIVPYLGVDIILNPEKETNPYAPDFLSSGRLADLKTQNTPFFTAGRYKKDASRTVTYNRKDLERYKRKYPGIRVYFYVRWNQLRPHFGSESYQRSNEVRPLHGVWTATNEAIEELVQTGRAPEHAYQRRVEDKVNANSSFLLSLDDLELVASLGNY